MKVKIEFTVDVDANVIQTYMDDLCESDKTKREFVKSWIQNSGISDLEESLGNNGFGYNTVEVVA
jgi:hypothetical protein|tara:strand:+ start:386 stop:580 length:195 start_codon:yes stop_codon:yes gene_type:complete